MLHIQNHKNFLNNVKWLKNLMICLAHQQQLFYIMQFNPIFIKPICSS